MSWYIARQVNDSKSSVMPPYVQRKIVLRICICSQNYLSVSYLWVSPIVTPYSNYKNLFRVSFCWCGIHHGPPSTRLFLSTSTHLSGISLRNKVVPWYLYTSMKDFFAFANRFTSLIFYWKIWLSVRHQIIYSHSGDFTRVPWESLTLMVISLALVNGSHNWPVIKWFLPCLTSIHCKHMDRIILC